MYNEIQAMRMKICKMGKMMFDRHLTDLAGGNIGVRMGDLLLMTPRYAGTKFHWELNPEQILILDLAGNKLDGVGDISRESKAHIDLLNKFYPHITASVHAHARNVLVFCAAEKDMPGIDYATYKFGVVKQSGDSPSGTQLLSDYIVAEMDKKMDMIKSKGTAACMIPRHGMMAVGKDLDIAMDSVERIDTNAYILLNAAAVGGIVVPSQILENPDYDK